MRKMFITLILLLMNNTIFGDDKYSPPVVTIGGVNGAVDYGEMVILSADYDLDHPPQGLKSIIFNWTIIDEGKEKKTIIVDGGKQIAFAVGMKKRKILVSLSASCLFETTKKIKLVGDDGKPVDSEMITDAKVISPKSSFVSIDVGIDPPPVPIPDPEPTPTPVPIIPSGQFGLASFIYNAFVADVNIPTQTKVVFANRLADGLDAMSQKVQTNPSAYTNMSVILAETKTVNETYIATIPGLDLSLTTPLKNILRSKIMELYNANKVNNPTSLVIAYQELSQGLRKVNK